jgi:hypothetical protein
MTKVVFGKRKNEMNRIRVQGRTAMGNGLRNQYLPFFFILHNMEKEIE